MKVLCECLLESWVTPVSSFFPMKRSRAVFWESRCWYWKEITKFYWWKGALQGLIGDSVVCLVHARDNTLVALAKHTQMSLEVLDMSWWCHCLLMQMNNFLLHSLLCACTMKMWCWAMTTNEWKGTHWSCNWFELQVSFPYKVVFTWNKQGIKVEGLWGASLYCYVSFLEA